MLEQLVSSMLPGYFFLSFNLYNFLVNGLVISILCGVIYNLLIRGLLFHAVYIDTNKWGVMLRALEKGMIEGAIVGGIVGLIQGIIATVAFHDKMHH
jgi:hypothetical protein